MAARLSLPGAPPRDSARERALKRQKKQIVQQFTEKAIRTAVGPTPPGISSRQSSSQPAKLIKAKVRQALYDPAVQKSLTERAERSLKTAAGAIRRFDEAGMTIPQASARLKSIRSTNTQLAEARLRLHELRAPGERLTGPQASLHANLVTRERELGQRLRTLLNVKKKRSGGR